MKKLILVAIISALALVGCSSDSTDDSMNQSGTPEATTPTTTESSTSESSTSEEMMEFTKDQLEDYDGKDGMPAYVAIDGVVYDVSAISAWAGGKHQDMVEAGKDLSDKIGSSPHGMSVLEKLPVVGTYVG